MSAVEWAERIAAKLHTAARRRLRPFGAERHKFEVLRAINGDQLRAFEAVHGIELPDEYRAFLTCVSRGGAGPAYGLRPFERTLWPELGPLPKGFLAAPFPFETAFQPELARDGDLRDIQEKSGTLVLCHEGCGYHHFLVCSGSARGQMWIDSTDNDGPYTPLGVGFLDWYERWLDDVLAGGKGTWWLHSTSEDDTEFQVAMRSVKPWWRR